MYHGPRASKLIARDANSLLDLSAEPSILLGDEEVKAQERKKKIQETKYTSDWSDDLVLRIPDHLL